MGKESRTGFCVRLSLPLGVFMLLLDIIKHVNIITGILFMVCYTYQVIYLIVGTVVKPKKFAMAEKTPRFAFVIAARNEEDVIGQLCDSIKTQDYPSELIDIYVVADNCTDQTANVAKGKGACVFERFNKTKIGKGYALQFLFESIKEKVGFDCYEGFFVVDADNILDKNYVYEMNKCIAAGNKLIMCYRNSKNYGENWISAGYSLWFLRASRHLNNPRQYFGTSAEITGTGFFVHKDIIERDGGWVTHSLIEDIEFTIQNVIKGEKVAFCNDAIVYDEQPTSFSQSFHQRKRWTKGYIYILKNYAFKLFGRFFKGKGFSNFDMIMAVSPAFFITAFALAFNALMLTLIAIVDFSAAISALTFAIGGLAASYVLFFVVGLVAALCEWDRIHTTTKRKICSLFTFPIFMATYVPITFAAMFSKAEWREIKHRPTSEDFLDK